METDANFAATLSAWAVRRPAHPALIEPGPRRAARPGWRSVTFSELEALANRYASGLARAGVRLGDRVLYLLWPSIEGYAAFYALLRLGAIPAFIDPRMGLRPLLASVRAIRPRVVIAEPVFHALRLIARRPFATAEVLITSGRRLMPGSRSLRTFRSEGEETTAVKAGPGDECYLPFTSGATGPAKGVFYTHGMVRAQIGLVREVCAWREGMSAVMCYAPFVAYALADGLTAILPDIDFSQPAAARPSRIVEALTAHRAECAFASPIVWMHLVRHCEKEHVKLPDLRRAVASGAPVQPGLHQRLARIIHPEGRLYTPYGATEAMPVTTADSLTLADTWQQTRDGSGTCVGKPLPGIEVRVIRVTDEPIPDWSDDLCVAPGAIGELVVGGSVVSPAYADRPDETSRAKIRRGGEVLHRMGDLGRVDEEGRVWFCGRKSHRLETRAGMLAPVPLENIFNEHPNVFRAAVIGLGPPGAAVPVACVELERGATFTSRLEAELIELADATCFKGVVTRFLPHPGFPVDPRHNAKIKREELAVWAAKKLRTLLRPA
ncbi:MAG TPA: fatty acid CoA ligase family protein [Gemmatimonadales bacterium]|jgi:acyl-CoA synthetase (AMP-forming)/AMP-acid ligase II|nr:fatty acid CoA ligase family protein [Gemmatimonadales bacterium]